MVQIVGNLILIDQTIFMLETDDKLLTICID